MIVLGRSVGRELQLIRLVYDSTVRIGHSLLPVARSLAGYFPGILAKLPSVRYIEHFLRSIRAPSNGLFDMSDLV